MSASGREKKERTKEVEVLLPVYEQACILLAILFNPLAISTH
jgi:hypothetical protein